MRHFTEEDVRRLLPMKAAVERLREAFRDYAAGTAQNQPRRRLFLETGSILHSLAGAWGGYFGTKVYSTHPRHGAHFTVLLYDAATATPLAQFEANWLGQIRTGAASGLAADLLLPPGPVRVGCIGSGFQAHSQLDALHAVRPIAEVRVWSRKRENREAFARSAAERLGVRAVVAESAEDAAAGADVLITATWAKDPVVDAAAVPTGALVLAMGTNHPDRRELPPELVTQSWIVADDRDACRIEAGDLLLALGEKDWESVVELKDLVANPSVAESRGQQTAIFKSVGLGLEDVAVAAWVLQQAAK